MDEPLVTRPPFSPFRLALRSGRFVNQIADLVGADRVKSSLPLVQPDSTTSIKGAANFYQKKASITSKTEHKVLDLRQLERRFEVTHRTAA